jgi:hypothetical protein
MVGDGMWHEGTVSPYFFNGPVKANNYLQLLHTTVISLNKVTNWARCFVSRIRLHSIMRKCLFISPQEIFTMDTMPWYSRLATKVP